MKRSDESTAGVFLHHHNVPGLAATDAPAVAIDTDALGERFPHLLRGHDLTAAMADMAAAGTCSAAAVRVIPSRDGVDPESTLPAVIVAGRIDALCQNYDGRWGVWDTGTLGCCLPGIEPSAAARLMETLAGDVQEQTPSTVLICGIAGHPLLSYAPDDLAANANKAIDHAAFFDNGAVVALDAVTLNISGDRAFEADNVAEAMLEYHQALTLDDTNVNVLNSLGACYGHVGAYEKALQYLEAAVAADAEEYMAVYNIGLTRLLMADRNSALDQFARAAVMAPEVFEPALQLGRLLQEDGKPAEALEYLERAAQLRPSSGTTQKLLGQCHEALDHLEPAIAAYKKAVTQNPNDPETLSALGCLFDKQGENPEITIIFCQQSVDLAPDNGLYRRRLGQLYLKQGLLAEALEAFKAADRCGTDTTDLVTEVRDRMDQSKTDRPN